jgi:hypothetical protein
MEVSGQPHAPEALPSGKQSLVPGGGTHSWSGHADEQENSQPMPGLEPPIIQPVAQCYEKSKN